MKKRINTVGYLFGHWGTGIIIGGMLAESIRIAMIGLFVHLIGQFMVGMTKQEFRS